MMIIDDRKAIFCNYFKGWFFIDILAIIPFDIILEKSNFNSLVRIARFGRLYKLVKLSRIMRVLKVFKENNKLMKFMLKFLKIGMGMERLLFLFLMFVVVLHVISCLWIIVAQFYS